MAVSPETSSKNGGFLNLVLASLLEGPKTAQHRPTGRLKRITESALRVRSVLDNKTWGSAEGVQKGRPRFNTPSWVPKMAISLETSSKNGAFIYLVLASLLEGPKTAQHSPTRRPKRAPGWPKLASTWLQNGLQEGSRRSKMAS